MPGMHGEPPVRSTCWFGDSLPITPTLPVLWANPGVARHSNRQARDDFVPCWVSVHWHGAVILRAAPPSGRGDRSVEPQAVAERPKLCHRWGGWHSTRGETLTAPAVGSSYWFGMKSKHPKIKTISIARLYSLGNYEHIRFELTAEVPDGCSAKATLLELGAVCGRMRPIKKPYDYDRAKEIMNKLPEALNESEKARLDDYREIISKFEAEKALQRDALDKLDQLGGTSKKGGGRKDTYDEEAPW